MDEVHTKLAEITEMIEAARAMPMSASCLVNRDEMLELLRALESLLPETISQAQEEIVAAARAERRRLLEATDVYEEAKHESDRLLDEARGSAETMRVEVEDYVDAKLANFEIVLTKTLSAVERGRQKLSGRHELDDLQDADLDVEPLPG